MDKPLYNADLEKRRRAELEDHLITMCSKEYPALFNDTLRFLLKNKINAESYYTKANYQEPYFGYSAIATAIYTNNLPAVKMLLPYINIEMKPQEGLGSFTPLLLSICLNRKRITRYLLDAGANKEAIEQGGENNALILSVLHAKNGSAKIVKVLLKAGISARKHVHRNNRGETALDIARKLNHQKIIALLENKKG